MHITYSYRYTQFIVQKLNLLIPYKFYIKQCEYQTVQIFTSTNIYIIFLIMYLWRIINKLGLYGGSLVFSNNLQLI